VRETHSQRNGSEPVVRLALSIYADMFAICRLPPGGAPALPDAASFYSVTRTPNELSVICPEHLAPTGAAVDGGWRCLGIHDNFGLDTPGILLSVLQPLSEAGISVFAVATFATDHILVRAEQIARVTKLLIEAGHEVTSAP
jgi:hypothetical protein